MLTWAAAKPGAVLYFHLPHQLLQRELCVLPQGNELLHFLKEAAFIVPGTPETRRHQLAETGPQKTIDLPGAAV